MRKKKFLWIKSQMRMIIFRNLKLMARLRHKPTLNSQWAQVSANAHYGSMYTVRA